MCQLFTCRNKNCGRSSSCSAWESRSAATYLGLAVSSATTRISLGPAMESMLHDRKRLSLQVLHRYFQVLRSCQPSGYSLCSVNKGCNCLCTADLCRSYPHRLPFGCNQCIPDLLFHFSRGGVTMMISSTPATFAGITFISTEDG